VVVAALPFPAGPSSGWCRRGFPSWPSSRARLWWFGRARGPACSTLGWAGAPLPDLVLAAPLFRLVLLGRRFGWLAWSGGRCRRTARGGGCPSCGSGGRWSRRRRRRWPWGVACCLRRPWWLRHCGCSRRGPQVSVLRWPPLSGGRQRRGAGRWALLRCGVLRPLVSGREWGGGESLDLLAG